MRKYLSSLLLVTTALLFGCAQNPVSKRPDLVLMSEEAEIAMGAKLHPQVLQTYPPVADPELQAYVTQLGDELAAVSERSHLDFTFTVIDDPNVNAFAMPGGYIYVTRGMLTHLNSEAELAAVIGHEIGHVTARHSVKRDANSKLLQGLAMAGSVATGTGVTGQAAQMLGSAALSGYGRAQELQADELGARYMAEVGYSPNAILRTVEMLKQRERFEIERARAEGREPRTPHGLFATHPDNDKRFAEALETARAHAANTPSREDNAERFLDHIDGLPWGPAKMPGVVRKNHFYNGKFGMKIKFPEDWRVSGEPDQVIAISPENDAMMQVFVVVPGRNMSAEEVIRRKLGLNKIVDGQEMTVAGLPAYIATSPRYASPWGPRPVRAAAIIDPRIRRAYVFAGFGKRDLSKLARDGDYIATIFTFDRMAREERDLARPPRVKIVRAEPGTTMSQLADNSAVATFAEQNLRLINGLYPEGEPQEAQLIKTVD